MKGMVNGTSVIMDHFTDVPICAPDYLLFILEMLNYLKELGMKFIAVHFILNCIQDIGFLINIFFTYMYLTDRMTEFLC